MQTRRDQLHAYCFLTRRALAALVIGEPNAVDPPMRRLTVTTVSGVMIAVLVAAGFAVSGFLKPTAGQSWKSQGTIIVERETGARYVYLQERLDPVLNYSSGVLAVSGQGQAAAHVTLVDRSEIAGVKRGPTIGIDGIPDSLPSSAHLVTSPWTVCSRQRSGRPTELQASVSVFVGSDAAAKNLPDSQSVVVQTPTSSSRYLLWRGQRLSVGSEAVATLLDIQSTTPLIVGTAFLDALPPGPALRTPTVPGLGGYGPVIGGQATLVGQLIAASDTHQTFLALARGVAPVGAVQAALLRSLTLPDGQHLPLITTSEASILDVPQASSSAVSKQFAGLPTIVPSVASGPAQNGGLCAVYRGKLTAPSLVMPASLLPAYQSATIVESATSRHGVADSVVVSPGHAAIVRSGDGSPTVFLVAQPGRKYAFAEPGLLTAFGYRVVTASTLPGQLLPLVPTGPALDAAAARKPVTG